MSKKCRAIRELLKEGRAFLSLDMPNTMKEYIERQKRLDDLLTRVVFYVNIEVRKKQILEKLKHCGKWCYLVNLDLTDDDMEYISKRLEHTKHVMWFHLQNNNITIDGLQKLVDIIDTTNINWIYLHGNPINEEDLKKLKRPKEHFVSVDLEDES